MFNKSANWIFSIWRFFILACISFSTHAQLEKQQVLKDVKTLSSDEFEGRKPLTKGHIKAQNYIVKQFQQLQLEPYFPNYRQVFAVQKGWSQIKGVNLAGLLKAKEQSDYYWIITAHYDHLGIIGGKVYNGANDNASGVAGLLAVARHFAKVGSNYNLVFLATDAEEQGLIGARQFVQQQPQLIQQTILNVNLDMIGDGAKRKTLYAMGNTKKLGLRNFIEHYKVSNKTKVFRLRAGYPRPNHGSLIKVNWRRASDHAAFAKVQVPHLYFGANTNKVYHSPKDDFSKIKPDFLFSSISAIIVILEELQSKPASEFVN